MAIPTYDKLFNSVLDALSDGDLHTLEDIRKSVYSALNLSKEDQEELLPSKKQTKIDNRIGWAKTYLVKAGLIEKPMRNNNRLTEEGKRVQKSGELVDLRFLERYDGYIDFINKPTKSEEDPYTTTEKETYTPDERLDNAFEDINRKLESDLLDEVKKQTPKFFEKMVVDLLQRMYGGSFKKGSEVTGRSGDEGIDGIIKQDRLGFNSIYIQAKNGRIPK